MNCPRSVILDFDLTLADSLGACVQRAQKTGRVHYGREITADQVKKCWGLPFPEYLARLYQTDEPYEVVAAKHLAIAAEFPLKLFDGVLPALDKLLSRMPAGILTASNNDIIDSSFPGLGLDRERFFMVQTSDHTEHHKPDPRVFMPMAGKLAQMGICPAEVLYVGDHPDDFKAAIGAGIPFLGVTTGITGAAAFEDLGAHYVNSFSEVPDVLLK